MKSQEEISLKNRPESLKPEGDWSNIFSYHPMDVELKRSEGIHYFDVNDNKYIDVTSGPFAFSLPHNDPRMKKAIADQMEAFSHITPTMANRPLANYSAKLQEVTPPKLNTVYPVSGGSEAVETAIKVAREHHVTNGNTDKYKIISNYQSYHGMTLATQGLSGNPAYAKKYGAILNKWPHIHQYSDHEKPEGMSREDWGIKCAQELEKAIYFEGVNSVAAYIATPHGCGSEYAVVPPKEYWQEIRRICDHYNVLLIADEVVTGFGRTGKWFAMEHFGVEVDIMTIAKGMSGCYVPMGGVVISDEINEAFIKNNAVFAHGFTNSGNPLACAAASMAIDIYKDDKLIENSAAMGKKIESYKDMLLSHPTVKDMRGWGLMWVLEMVENKDSGEYFSIDKGAEGTFHSIAMQNGLVFYSTMYGRRREPLFKRGLPLMISPPLCINESQIEEMMDKVDHSISLWEAEMGVA